MAHIRPFAGIRYSRRRGFDFSNLIAPPYDVLSDAGKAKLQAKHPNNIVTADLPHLPAKTVGPDQAYAQSNTSLQEWLSTGVLERDPRSALYPYTQSYDHGGRTFHRRGLIAVVRLSPFGAGEVVPHEQTYPDAIHDRLKLTRATGLQLSPIFGLFSDARNEVTNALYHNLGRPEISATMDGVKNDLWSVTDGETINKVTDLFGSKPVYIADGHHRYTMALQYQKETAEKNGGTLPPTHSANYCMFVLVGMQDPGLLILPTHRIIGGLDHFRVDRLQAAAGDALEIAEVPTTPDKLPEYIDVTLPKQPPNTFGLYDAATRKTYQLRLKSAEVMKKIEPKHSDAWRQLDVAVLQRYLLDELLKPTFAGGKDPTRAYTAYANEVVPMTDGTKYQIALLLKSTPLHALEDLGKHKEVMPQKSTFFYPKLATGMVMYPVK